MSNKLIKTFLLLADPALAVAAAGGLAHTPDRKAIHPQTHLAKSEGALQADASADFNALFDEGTIREVAYWAHAGRKFHDLHAARATPLTTEALRGITELYSIETDISKRLPSAVWTV